MKSVLAIFICILTLSVTSFAQKKDSLKIVIDDRPHKHNPEKPVLLIINGTAYDYDISNIDPYDIEAYDVVSNPLAWEKYGVASFNGVIALKVKTNNSNKTDTLKLTAWDIFNSSCHNPVYIINNMIIDERLSKQTINTLDRNSVVDLTIKNNQSSAQRATVIISTKQ